MGTIQPGKDYSQSKDLAKENPEKLAELKAVFDKEATDNRVSHWCRIVHDVFRPQ
jgi:hypothetical protein